MAKRKSKRKAATKSASSRPKAEPVSATMPVPAVALKVLAVILGLIMIVALTLYVSGRMPAKGFWTLAILLALIAFLVMPFIRKRYVKG